MKIVAVVQARMTSSRLPGKVLMGIAGEPMLGHVVRRLRHSVLVAETVVACTERTEDDPIDTWCRQQCVRVVRGSETDVLGRFVQAAHATNADVVVRVTADCPLIDPQITDRVIRALWADQTRGDYAANVLERSFPRGLDVEALWTDALHRLDAIATSPEDREHVTAAIRRPGETRFTVRSVRAHGDDSDLRWTVDTPDDLAAMRRLIGALELDRRVIPYPSVVDWCRAHPEHTLDDHAHLTWDPIRT